MDSKKRSKKKKKVVKPSQSSTNATVAKSIAPVTVCVAISEINHVTLPCSVQTSKDSFDPSKFISDKC